MSFEPSPDEFNWQAETRPRKFPRPPLTPASIPTPEPAPGRFVVPLVIVVGLAVLGAMAGAVGVLVLHAQRVPVTVIVDSNALQTLTDEATVGEVLDELGITVGDFDVVTPPVDTPVARDLVVRVDTARRVTVTVDGATRLIWTPLANPADILEDAGVNVRRRDRVLVDGTETTPDDLAEWPVPASNITLRRAVRLEIVDGGTSQRVTTVGETVGDALFEAGVTLYLADTVSPEMNARLEDDMTITISRSRPVSIIADGRTLETRVQGETVADVLAEAGVALVGLDYPIPSEDARLVPGMHIRIIRVHEETVTEEAPVPFETVYQADANRELDQIETVQVGREGVQETAFRVRYENGIEISRQQGETTIIQEPVNHVIAYGTNVVVRTIDTPDGPREYWRVVRMYATSYHPAALGGDDVTATGRRLQKGIIAVDRSVVDFGTELYVPGYGVGLAADTGRERSYQRWVDLGYSDADFEPWTRYVDVYFLTPVPAEIDYILPE